MIDTTGIENLYTIINVINAGLSNQPNDYFDIYPYAATPDGKYVYMNYNDYNSGLGMLAIFDIVNGGPATTLTMSSLEHMTISRMSKPHPTASLCFYSSITDLETATT